jgi:hypothetical protein
MLEGEERFLVSLSCSGSEMPVYDLVSAVDMEGALEIAKHKYPPGYQVLTVIKIPVISKIESGSSANS